MTTLDTTNTVGETLLIRGVDVPVQTVTLLQADLRFFVDNPGFIRSSGQTGSSQARSTSSAS